MSKPKRTQKPRFAVRAAKSAGLGIFNFAEDALFEALNTVPGYPKLTPYHRSTPKKKRPTLH